jgi:predicted acyltransferase
MSDNQRNLALDVFRGMTVCFMIIVNNLAFVMHKYEAQGDGVFWRKTLKRTFIIFLIGYLLSWFPFFYETAGGWKFRPLSETRILGVLQRIALCYFFASIILHYASKKVAVILSVLILFGYWIVMYVWGDPNDPYSMIGNAGSKLDLILGEKHLYHGEGIAFEPEGILSTLPSIVNVIGGYLAGDYIRRKGNTYETISKLLLAGALLIFAALTWNMVFPINKKLWTSSFVLLTVGIDLIILPALIFLIDYRKSHKWTNFFVVFGKNPLFIYILADVLATAFYLIPMGKSSFGNWLFKDFYGSLFNPLNASLLYALTFMMICWAIGYVMDRRKIYVRV